jgi:hypothetical protein
MMRIFVAVSAFADARQPGSSSQVQIGEAGSPMGRMGRPCDPRQLLHSNDFPEPETEVWNFTQDDWVYRNGSRFVADGHDSERFSGFRHFFGLSPLVDQQWKAVRCARVSGTPAF